MDEIEQKKPEEKEEDIMYRVIERNADFRKMMAVQKEKARAKIMRDFEQAVVDAAKLEKDIVEAALKLDELHDEMKARENDEYVEVCNKIGNDQKPLYTNDTRREIAMRKSLMANMDYMAIKKENRELEKSKARLTAELTGKKYYMGLYKAIMKAGELEYAD